MLELIVILVLLGVIAFITGKNRQCRKEEIRLTQALSVQVSQVESLRKQIQTLNLNTQKISQEKAEAKKLYKEEITKIIRENEQFKDNIDGLLKERDKAVGEAKKLRENNKEVKTKDKEDKKVKVKGTLCTKCKTRHTVNAHGVCTVCIYRKGKKDL
jgi:hypothetical protein